MATQQTPQYDFFISYRHGERDESFARDILAQLEATGLKGAIDERDFHPAKKFLNEMERCIKESRNTVCIISPRYLQSGNCEEEAVICKVLDMADRKERLIPLTLEKVVTPAWLYGITGVDFTKENPLVPPIERLKRALGKPLRPPAAGAGPGPVHNLPQRNAHFTGRLEVLAKIERALGTNSAIAGLTQIHGISGLGGIGKTQTALEFAWRHLGQSYRHVFWVRADTETEIISGFMEIARKLELAEKDARETDVVVDAVRRWFDINDNWLLVLDNVEWDGQQAVAQYVPCGRGHVLVTSRAHALDALDIQQPIPLDKMEPGEAGAFLTERTGRQASAAVDAVAKALDYLPLALEQAAAYIVENACSFDDYLASFEKRRKEYLRYKSKKTEYPDTAATTWLLNFEQVEAESKASRDLLYVCAFLDPDKIPLEIFRAGAKHLGRHLSAALADAGDDPVALNEVLAPVVRYSLVRRGEEDGALSIHRLVQDVIRTRMNTQQQATWAKRAVPSVSAAFPYGDFEEWPLCEQLLPHARLAVKYIHSHNIKSKEAARFLNQVAYYLHERAQHREAEPLMRRALEIDEEALGPKHPKVAIRLNNLALLLKDTNRIEEAEPLYRRALEIDEEALGPKHPDVAIDLNNLAQLLKDTNRLEEAEPLYRRALEIDEEAYGPEHPDVAIGLNNLAQLLKDTNRLEEAEPLMRRALEIDEEALGPKHPKVAIDLNNLAQLLKDTNRLEEAEPLMRRALEIDEEALGPKHPKVAIRLNNLAGLLQDTNRLEEAEPLMRRALEIDQEALGPNHPKVAIRLNNLAGLLKDTNRLEEAEPLMRRSVEILRTFRESTGYRHPGEHKCALNYLLSLIEMGLSEDEALVKVEEVSGLSREEILEALEE